MLKDSLINLKEKINNQQVRILVACKYATSEQVQELFDLDKNLIFGWNTTKQAKEMADLQIPIRQKHMIGHLQRNKVKDALELFSTIQSVDSLKLAEKINALAKTPVNSYIEVNTAEEENKQGINEQELDKFYDEITKFGNLAVVGLMTMASSDPNKNRGCFRRLRKLADNYRLKTSMGTSRDFEIAVEEGTDMIRIGSILFK